MTQCAQRVPDSGDSVFTFLVYTRHEEQRHVDGSGAFLVPNTELVEVLKDADPRYVISREPCPWFLSLTCF